MIRASNHSSSSTTFILAKFQVSIWNLDFQRVKLESILFQMSSLLAIGYPLWPPMPASAVGERRHASRPPVILVVRAPILSSRSYWKLPVPTVLSLSSSSGDPIEPSRRRPPRRPRITTPPRFVAPGAAQTRRPPTPHLPERSRALTRPKSSRRPPLAIVVPAELRPSPLSHSSGHPPPQIDPR